MGKNDKYKAEIREPGLWTVCVESQPVFLCKRMAFDANITYMPLAFEDQTVAEDFCYLLNQAFLMRMAVEQSEKAEDKKACPHDHGLDEDGCCNLCGFYG